MNKYAVIVGIEYKNLKEKIPNILSRIYDIRKNSLIMKDIFIEI